MANTVVKVLSVLFCATLLNACGGERSAEKFSVPSRARWHNNQGVVYMDQHNYTRARGEFESALQRAPGYAGAHANLGISFYSLGKYDSAATALQTALRYDPDLLQAHFTLGLIYNAQGKEHEKALASLDIVAAADPDNPHVRYYLGQVRAKLGQNEIAVKDFRETIRLDPYNVSAYYGLANAYRRLGKQEDWRAALEEFNKLSQAGHSGVSSSYQGQGRYAEVVSDAGGGNAGADDRQGPFSFGKARQITPPPAFAALLDYDGDGIDDILTGGPIALYRSGSTAVAAAITVDPSHSPLHAVAADLDNDDLKDLIISGEKSHVYQALAASEWSQRSPLPMATVTVPGDMDHDGDIDLLLLGQQGRHLLANDGKAVFADITATAGLAVDQAGQQAIFTDFDNDRDIDFFVVSPSGLQLYSNNRDGTFSDLAEQLGLAAIAARAIAVEDFDQDSYMDLAVLSPAGELTLWSNAAGLQFTKGSSLSVPAAETLLSADVDNDGDIDLWAVGKEGATLLAWHRGALHRTTGLLKGQNALPALAADFNGDGRTDLWSAGQLLENKTAGGHWVRIALQGLNSNHDAIGAKVEIKTENRLQKRELRSGDAGELLFGLAKSDSLEFVRILWPGGVRQTELATGAGQRLELTELDRKGTSCPIVYVWDGEHYRFVSDILGGAIIGYYTAPGQYYYPDSDEYLPLGPIAARNGSYSIKLTNQLEEIIYIDALELIAIDHPAGVEIFPNERLLSSPPYPSFELYPLSDLHPPIAASDQRGKDVLAVISEIDDDWYQDFGLTDIHGYAEQYSLTLDLGDLSQIDHPALLAYGWVDYAHSTSNWAAAQRDLNLNPPRIEVADGRGGWRLFNADMGTPAGLPKHMLFDLKDAFIAGAGDYRVRITTNAAIYWDQFLVGSSLQVALQVHRAKATNAELNWRGYPAHTAVKGTFAFRYHYDKLQLEAPWGTHGGSYTRLGSVDKLVDQIDDHFAIMFHGDELSAEFAVDAFPPLGEGLQRSFLLYADGFGKDMDFHSAHSLTVEPLPFHGMSTYPYPANEHYPQTQANIEYLEEYNTRIVRGYYK